MLILFTGTVAGLLHVLSGPDHLAAVAPLAAEGGRTGWRSGWTWGVGHTSGVVVVAILAVLLRDALPSVDILSTWGERLVGGALVGLGLWALRHSAGVKTSAHQHGRISHDHLHVQGGPRWLRRMGHAHASFCMGVLHGVAGSSHFLGILPALGLPTPSAALLYIGGFGTGTIGAMTMFAAVIGSCSVRTARGPRAHRIVMAAAACLAIGVGVVWLTAPLV